MRALILLAHGSKRKESAQEIADIAKELEDIAIKNRQFDIIKQAFMQFCKPDFYQVVDELIQVIGQFGQIVILPYFISAGSHVAEDIPELIKRAMKQYPDISFTVTPHLGKFNGLKRLMLEELNDLYLPEKL